MADQAVLTPTKRYRNTWSTPRVRKAYLPWDQGVIQPEQFSNLTMIEPAPRAGFVTWVGSNDSIELLQGGARGAAQDDEFIVRFRRSAAASARSVLEAGVSLRSIKVPPMHDFGLLRILWKRVAESEEDPLTQYEAFFAEAYSPIGSLWSTQSRGQVSHIDQDRNYGILEPNDPDSSSAEGLWVIARDMDAVIETRVDALSQLATTQEEVVARYIVDELCGDDILSNWRNALILLAEHLQFNDDTVRARLRVRLLEFAECLRQSTEAGIKYVVWSAIRTYVSLIASCKGSSLLELLDPPNPVETRLVTLQCIVHLFETEPAEKGESMQEICNRVHELAMKFLDRDWLVPGEKAAIGQCATQALAALGDQRLQECITRIQELRKPWVTRQVAQKLQALLATWEANPDARGSDACALVRRQLEVLRD